MRNKHTHTHSLTYTPQLSGDGRSRVMRSEGQRRGSEGQKRKGTKRKVKGNTKGGSRPVGGGGI